MSFTAEEVKEAIKDVKHPEINDTLINLGIVKDVKVEDGKIIITINLPFPQVPEVIVSMFIQDLKGPLSKFNAEVVYKRTYMTKEEVDRFLKLEQEGWRF